MNKEKREGFAGVVSFLREARKNRIWRYVTSVLAVFVVFVTAYVLILPGVALSSSDLTPQLSIKTMTATNTTYEGENYTSYLNVTLQDVDSSKITAIKNNGNVCYLVFPEGISLPSSYDFTQVQSGVDGSNNEIFTYTYQYSDDGLLYAAVTFKDGYLESVGGSLTDGYFYFQAILDSSLENSDYNLEITNNGTVILTIKAEEITSTITDSTPSSDLTVTKSAGGYQSDGTITYTVYVETLQGSGSEITLEDALTITGDLSAESITVGKVELQTKSWQYGEWTTSNGAVSYTTNSSTASGINLTLPELTVGTGIYSSRYAITYTVQLKDITDYTSVYTVGNAVKASSVSDWNNTTISGSATVSTTISFDLLSKSGTADDNAGTIKWTLTLNNEGMNLAGMTLTDTMFSSLTETELAAALTNAGLTSGYTVNKDNGVITGITFNSATANTGTYTITYTTSADSVQLASDTYKVSNTAELTGGVLGSGSISNGAEVSVSRGSVSKSDGTAVSYNDTDNTVDVQWMGQVSIPVGGIASGTIIGDYLGDSGNYKYVTDQWFRYSQLSALNSALSSISVVDGNNTQITGLTAGTDFTVYVYDITDGQWVLLSTVISNSSGIYEQHKYTAFEIRFIQEVSLSKAGSISLTYTSTVDRSATSGASYYNNQWVVTNGQGSMNDYGTYTDYQNVQKTDGNGQTGTTSVGVDDDGIVAWYAKVYIRKGSTSAYTVVDTLPEGVSLKNAYVSTSASGTSGTLVLSLDQGGSSYTAASVTGITASVSGQEVTVVVGADAYSSLVSEGGYYYIYYECVLSSDKLTAVQGGTSVDLSNSVSVQYENSAYGTATQSQTVTYGTSGGETSQTDINKESAWNSNTSILSYSVLINPDGETLADAGSTLTLTDNLSANYGKDGTWGRYVTLVSQSVHFYLAKADGTADYDRELDIAWQYSESSEEYDIYISMVYTITSSDIPDGMAIVLEYQYEVWHFDNGNSHIDGITNSATLVGKTTQSALDNASGYYQGLHFKAGIASTGTQFMLVKVEKGNYSNTLSGAEYTLYKWSSTVNDWAVENTYTTDTDGEVTVYDDDCAVNTAYKLVETKAPSGYVVDSTPYYFYKSDSSTTATSYPDDFITSYSATDLSVMSKTAYAENSKKPEDTTTSVSVTKSWVQLAESTTTIPDEVTVDLYRYEDTSASGGNTTPLTVNVYANHSSTAQTSLSAEKNTAFTIYVDAGGSDYVSWYGLYDESGTAIDCNWSYSTWNDYKQTLTLEVSETYATGDLKFEYGTTNGSEATVNILNSSSPAATGSYTASDLPSGTKVGTYTITKSAGWTLTIDDLTYESYDENGVKHTYLYYFVEQSIAGYETTYSLNVGVNEGGSITITNTEQDGTYTYTEAAVTKTWANSDTTSTDDISSYYKSATFALYRVTGTDLTTATKVGEITLDGVVDTEETIAWTYTWSNLVASYTPTGATNPTVSYTYYVAETATELASNAALTGTTYQSDGSEIAASSLTVDSKTVNAYAYGNSAAVIAVTNTITITETPKEPVQTKVNISVNKAWSYVGCTENDVSGRSVTLGLYRISDASGATLEQVGTVTLDGVLDSKETTAWSYTWSDLLYTSTVDNVTTTYTYYIGEVSYAITDGDVVGAAWTDNVDTSSASAKTYSDGTNSVTIYPITGVSASATVQITLTNTVSAYKSIGITKKWINSSGTEISPASAEATFTLLRLLKNDSGYVTGADSKVVVNAQTLTLDSSNWSGSWTDLPTAVEYNGTVYECAYFVVETGVTNNGTAVDLSKYVITYTDANSNTISTTYTYADEVYYQVTNGSSVTVTNTSTEKSVVLPLTGGLGNSGRLVLLGCGMVFFSFLMIIMRRRGWRGNLERG